MHPASDSSGDAERGGDFAEALREHIGRPFFENKGRFGLGSERQKSGRLLWRGACSLSPREAQTGVVEGSESSARNPMRCGGIEGDPSLGAAGPLREWPMDVSMAMDDGLGYILGARKHYF